MRQLENALAADAIRRGSLESRGSDSEFSEATRRRRHHGSRPSSRTTKHNRITSNSSNTSRGSASDVRSSSDDLGSSRSEDRQTVVGEPKRSSHHPAEDNTMQLSSLRTDADLSALGPGSPVSPTLVTPIAPSLTTATSAVTDDEADYQSAYSTSPRDSYGSFEHFSANTEASDSELGTPTTKEYVVDLRRSYRDRTSSTATAKDTKTRYRASEDTVVTSPIGSI